MRFERTTYGLGIRCSILLSYGGNLYFSIVYNAIDFSKFYRVSTIQT